MLPIVSIVRHVPAKFSRSSSSTYLDIAHVTSVGRSARVATQVFVAAVGPG